MHRAAKGGNVAAQKAFLATTPALTAPAQAEPQAEKPVRRGKKEQAQVDAQTAAQGTDWSDLLPQSTGIPLQ